MEGKAGRRREKRERAGNREQDPHHTSRKGETEAEKEKKNKRRSVWAATRKTIRPSGYI